MDKLDEYTEVMTRLVSEAVACSPEEWSGGKLTIDCDGTRINYKLKNAKEPGIATLSEKLRDLIDELYVRMSRQGDVWTQAAIEFRCDGEDIEFSNSFQYPQTTQHAQAESAKRPWWKFGAGRA